MLTTSEKKLVNNPVQTPDALVITLCLGALGAFAPFATDMYLSGFPDIAQSFATSVHGVQLSISAFFFGLAIGQLIYGPLIDRLGRRVPLLVGVGLFTFASLLLTFTHNIEFFIGLRFVQALGGCAGMIVGRAIIQDLFDSREAARALSLMMIIQGVGPIVAPILGGYLVVSAGWRSIFIFLTIFALACLALSIRTLPETLPVHHRQNRSVREILEVFRMLLSQPSFMIPTLIGALMMSNLFAFIVGSPYVFMELYGVSQEWYGWLFALNALGMLVMGQVNRIMLLRYTPERILQVALIFSSSASLLVVLMTGVNALWQLLIPLFLALSVGPLIMANSVALAMATSTENSGSASSIIGIVQFAFAGLVTFLISLFHNGTAYPMTVYILIGSSLALATLYLGKQSLPETCDV